MFYYPNVLHRHTGCFSTIWLAATRGTRVTRRELLKVNVKLTCGDILGYVTAQVPPSQPNLPRPRFSLYLSSQLQYGVVVVYHSQCGFLLEEVQQTIDRFLRAKRCSRIDMAESDRLALNVPDSLYLMEETERAQDPFFGLMESHQLLSPYRILQTAFTSEDVGSQHSLVPSPLTTLNNEGFRSLSVAITLTEKEQFVITAENFEGEDLPEVTDREINLLMDQNDQFCKEVEEQRSRERTRELEGAMSSFDQLNKTAVREERDSVFLLDEETGQTVDITLASLGREMTPLRVAMPTPPSGESGTQVDQERERSNEEIKVCPIRRPPGSRRRQLVFADPQVQISDRAMKEQIVKPKAETLDLSGVLLDLPSLTKWATPAELFSAPCGSLPHADLQLLWKQCALLTALPVHGKNQSGEMEKEEEEEEARVESEQDREILRHSSMKQISSESGLQPADGSSVSDVILDISREDKSGNDVITPTGRWSPQEDTRPLMEPIAEENIEMPEAQTDTESKDMLSWISSILQRFAEVTFDSLLPPEADRTTAAHTLYKLLELLSAGHVTVLQTEPYSNMTITSA
ncbi:REC8 meiotic recombination protein b [Paralichthys olivaceus]|uniref:REC8 meiotic recombination protein b n=1 Tax=Paralichthys olivaceus TaxID=8255 RepID=UPI003751BD90